MDVKNIKNNQKMVIAAGLIALSVILIILILSLSVITSSPSGDDLAEETTTTIPTSISTPTATPTPGITLPPDVSVAEAFSPGNNCCNESDYSSCSSDQEWIAGFYACNDGECSKCSNSGVTADQCNNNNICEAGEQHVNCPSDCDEGGFSQLPEGSTCSPSNADNGRDDCDASAGLYCISCPSDSNNPFTAACSSGSYGAVSTDQNFIDTYCGGYSTQETSTSTPTPTTIVTTSSPVLPDTALDSNNIRFIIGGLILIAIGFILQKSVSAKMES